MLESYPETVAEFKNALQLIWSACTRECCDCGHECQPTVDILNI